MGIGGPHPPLPKFLATHRRRENGKSQTHSGPGLRAPRFGLLQLPHAGVVRGRVPGASLRSAGMKLVMPALRRSPANSNHGGVRGSSPKAPHRLVHALLDRRGAYCPGAELRGMLSATVSGTGGDGVYAAWQLTYLEPASRA